VTKAPEGFQPAGGASTPAELRLAQQRQRLVEAAHKMLGTPYVWGGNVPGKALDCSGFVQQAYLHLGVKLPRVTFDQVKQGRQASLIALLPGDLIFTEPGRSGPNHVGLYVGGGMVQESPHRGAVNRRVSLDAFVRGCFVAARRILV
jgi:cell wall-associated NlpC family hydrolase